MIRIFQGVPGSGKTYAMVHYLKRYAEWDGFYREWVLRDGVVVISNIEGLRIPCLSLDRLIAELGNIREVFSEGFVKTLWDKGYKKIIFAVDEAQRFFDRKFYDRDVFFFFQYHRHWGVDILLATQDVSTLPKEIRVLAEFLIRAEQRSLTLKSFKYKFYSPDGNTHLFNQTLAKDERVFAMYKSFHVEEIDKPPNVLIRQLVIPSLAFLLILFFAYLYVTLFMFPSSSPSPEESLSRPENVRPSPPSGRTSEPPNFSLPLDGYARVGSVYYYLTSAGWIRDPAGWCSVLGGALVCSRPVPIYRPRLRPSPEEESPTTDVGGRGLVYKDRNKSHTPTAPTFGGSQQW